MEALDIARWQFGIVTVYHFLMVPLTLGLGLLVAVMQTMWYKTGRQEYLRMTKFWGKLFLINFIMGVATGIVQEFQFGMAWSEYSRFVGDVFGVPLALEALLAFFVESTFLGLWIFGWKKLSKKIHLVCIWIVVIGSMLSAYFIIVANSWMQHPVGVRLVDGKPELYDIWALLTNNTAVIAFLHTMAGAFAVSGGFLLGISWYHLWRRRYDGIDTVTNKGEIIVGENLSIPGRDKKDYQVWYKSLRFGAWIAMVAFASVAITGDIQAKLMFEQQPMKMAAAEAACHDGTGFSILSIGNLGATDCNDIVAVIEIPGLLSFLANGDFHTEVRGVVSLIPEYQENFGKYYPDNPALGSLAGQPVEYSPILAVTYWGFRFMILFGVIAAFTAFMTLIVTRKGAVPESKWLMKLAVLSILAPFAANIFGWIFTEIGRQPFVVVPNPSFNGTPDSVFMFTASAVSRGVSPGEILFSLITLVLIYAALLVVELKLLVMYVRGGVASSMPELQIIDIEDDDSDDKNKGVLAFAY